MKRIYSYYKEDDFNYITELAEKLGFSLSSFQRYCVMLYADRRGHTSSINNLRSEMLRKMQQVNIGETFIVSALLPEVWTTLSRSEKSTLSIQLANRIKKDPKFGIFEASEGKANIYKRLG